MTDSAYAYSATSTRNPFRYALALWRFMRSMTDDEAVAEVAIIEIGFARSRFGRRYRRQVRHGDVGFLMYFNHGRWILDCHNRKDGCTTAWEVNPALETIMTCHQCGAVTQSETPELWMEIESILNRRPIPATRNWMPHETVSDLLKENEAHGVDGP